jgi:uncharacterized protein YkwD
MKRALLLALMLAAPAAAATLPSPNWPAPADRGDALLRDAVLKAQNGARARFGVAPMAWSDELAAEAPVQARDKDHTSKNRAFDADGLPIYLAHKL